MSSQKKNHEALIAQLAKVRDVVKRRAALERQGFSGQGLEDLLDAIHFRTKGREKFPRAKEMRFTRQSLAQASAKAVAEYRTWKMRQHLGTITGVLDVGAGLGGDTIALALRWPVIALEKDPKIVELLRHNLDVYNVTDKVEIAQADARQWLGSQAASAWQKQVNAIFFDPSRRPGGKRVLQAHDWEPPLSFADELVKYCPNLAVKTSPLIEFAALPYDCDIEVISLNGQVRDLVLWFGGFKLNPDTKAILATKLPERLTLVRRPVAAAGTTAPKNYLYEPDPAFTKAQLVDTLAADYDLKLLDRGLGYLTGDQPVDTPILKRYRIRAQVPWNFDEISRRLTALNLGRIDFKARGVAVDLRTIHKQIKGRGKGRGLVVLTRIAQKKQALICTY